MFKTIFCWIACWSLLAIHYYVQADKSAAFVLLVMAYIPIFALLTVYLFGLADILNKANISNRKVARFKDFSVNILVILIMTLLLILSFSLPEITRNERALKFLLMYTLGITTSAIAMISFEDAFIPQTSSNKETDD
jgi:hypothetical protein